MSEQKILEGNTIIMIFDGWRKATRGTFDPAHNNGSNLISGYEKITETGLSWIREDSIWEMCYHVKWELLFPVVEKILEYKYEDGDTAYLRTFGMRNEEGEKMVRFNRHALFQSESLIKATWLAVVDFIEFENFKERRKTFKIYCI